MAVIVVSDDPEALWDEISSQIETGDIETWRFHSKNGRLTHTSEQWTKRAWWEVSLDDDQLYFNIIKPKDSDIDSDVYAEYHGLLIRMLLAHFDDDFSEAYATASPEEDDRV